MATLSVLCGAPALVQAEDSPAGHNPPGAVSPSYASVFNTAPPAANRIAPILQRTAELFQSAVAARRAIKQRRSEQDALKTKLTTINGEFEVLTQHRAQLQQQMVALEAEHQARLQSLRKTLEAKLEGELSSIAQQMQAEFEHEFASEVQGFEQRQRGEIEKLLLVPNYDFNWQLWYQLPRGKVLPKGTRIEATGTFDNSPNNKNNPDPTKEVRWGDQSWEEMMIGFFDVAIPADMNPVDVIRAPRKPSPSSED